MNNRHDNRKPVLVSWSGGKDSLLALDELLREGGYQIVSLLTTVAAGYDRVSHHGVRRELLHQQAAALGLPLEEVMVSPECTNAEYEARLAAALVPYRKQGLTSVVFGDLFLEDRGRPCAGEVVCRSRNQCGLPGGSAGERRPLWRERRVSHLRLRRSPLSVARTVRAGPDRRTRHTILLRFDS
jgi:hypothetical protein